MFSYSVVQWPKEAWLKYSGAIIVALLLFMGCDGPSSEVSAPSLAETRARVESEFQMDSELDQMNRVLSLDPTQSEALLAAYEKRDSEISAWLAGEKGQRLIALEADMARAAREQDLEGVRNATSQAKPLRMEIIMLIGDHEGAMRALLSEAQRDQWDGFQIAAEMLDLMEPLQLDGAQRSAIEAAGPQALTQARERGEVNPSAAAFLDLERWAEESVLSPEQRAGYGPIKSKHGLRSL